MKDERSLSDDAERPANPPPLIGLTGPNASGKGEVAALLATRGYALHSLSDIVRDEASRRGLTHAREDLIRVGNDLRAEGGAGALAERMLSRLRGRDVVDSIRNPGEVAVLRRVPGFLLLGVDAPPEVRFARARTRGRVGDGETAEEFRRREEKENSTDPARQQLRATLADLAAALDRVLRGR